MTASGSQVSESNHHQVRVLTAQQIEDYREDGFLVLERFVAPEACDELRARAEALVANFDDEALRSVFSTTSRVQDRDAYFLGSGGGIGFFFEEEAFDAAGKLTVPKARALNKLGHALHDLDPVFDRFSRDPKVAAAVADLGLAEPRLLQSMYIFKQPGIGGEVVPHQDATFLRTEPSSVLGLWFALEDADRDNGCLWALPGGQRGGLKSLYRRDAEAGLVMEVLDDSPFDLAAGRPLEVRKGTMVVLHGRLPHWSAPNRSPRSRHAYTLHVIDGGARYLEDNWLQRPPELPLRGF